MATNEVRDHPIGELVKQLSEQTAVASVQRDIDELKARAGKS